MRQAQHAHLRDASFTVAFTTAGASNTGSGTMTTTPARYQLLLIHTASNGQVAHLAVIDDATGTNVAFFAKQVGDALWSTLNDGEDGYFSNYDPAILNYDQLRGITFVGNDTSQGQAAWHLHATATIAMYASDGKLIPVNGTEDLWLRQADALPLMLQKSFSGITFDSDGATEPLQLQATYQFQRWNTGLTIALPEPGQFSASG